jgi:hypothetical protein
MSQKTRRSRSNVRVVAKVVNGATYVLMSTSDGLRCCQNKDITNQKRWERTGALSEMVVRFSRVRDSVVISASSEPNVSRPRLDLRFKTREIFLRSGVDLATSGSWFVRVIRPHNTANTTTGAAMQ